MKQTTKHFGKLNKKQMKESKLENVMCGVIMTE